MAVVTEHADQAFEFPVGSYARSRKRPRRLAIALAIAAALGGAAWLVKGRGVVTSAVRPSDMPATPWRHMASMASARVIAGRIVVRRRASNDFPASGAPSMNTLWSQCLDSLHLCVFMDER